MTSEVFFNTIETHYKQHLPFVIYRKPNETKVKALLQQTDALYKTFNFTEQGFVFSPFDDTQETVLFPLENCKTFVLNNYTDTLNHTSKTNSVVTTTAKEQHIALVEKAIEVLKTDALKKVVVSRVESVATTNNPFLIFKRLLQKYQSAFVYCWYHPKVGLWLGATPETLVKIEGNRFSIMALAGTQVYNGSLDVVWQNKELQEQQYVTDYVVENLKPATTSISVSKTNTVKAGNLLHLKTMIVAQLKQTANLNDVIKTIHPTPAVCGVPKQKAQQFILDYEPYNRQFYTGFLGELHIETTAKPRSGKRNIENRAYTITKRSTQLYVNLRCMQLKSNNALLYIGGGITKHSNAEKEWEETVAKSLVIKSVL